MSDDKKSLINLVPDSIDNAAKNITDAPTKSIGQTMADFWFLIFGGISQAADKKRARYNIELNKFKEELTASLEKVPEEHRKEPSSHVVLSALDESKFCVEEEELRKLFVSLLTSSTDSTKVVHPSFASIIRQMSPEDAILLGMFKEQASAPLCNLSVNTNNGSIMARENLLLNTPPKLSETQISLSVSSLVHLGLCTIPPGIHLANESLYEPFQDHPFYKSFIEMGAPQAVSMEKLILRLTPLGTLFVKCCLS